MMYRILIVDDERAITEILAQYLSRKGFQVFIENDPRKVEEKIELLRPHILFLDVRMPYIDGMTLFERIKDRGVYVVIMTAYASKESIIEAFRRGVNDYLLKPYKLKEVDIVLERALNILKLQDAYNILKEKYDALSEEQIITQNEKMLQILENAKRIAPLDITVMIYGESGTGKDLLARFIHKHSRRANGPFVPINLGAIPEELAESELFGHEKGAFTGAVEKKKGLFLTASGGTLFLDEIGEASLNLQVKLLRAIETKRILPLGATKEVEVDTRIIAATNQDLQKLVRAKKFRQDLYFRLNTMAFTIPPLRERKEDIPLLVKYFIKKASALYKVEEKGISKEALQKLLSYHWPGNVRELRHTIERALILSKGSRIEEEDIMIESDIVRDQHLDQERKKVEEEFKTLDELEREAIIRALRLFPNKKEAARRLGIDPSTLYRKLKKYNIKEVKE